MPNWSSKMSRRQNLRPRAFTIVELLVTIAVIVILAGLILSVLSGVRERVRRTACTSNLKQLHLALQMYKEDWQGRRCSWLSNLYPRYVSSLNVYVCPSDDSHGGSTSVRDWQSRNYPNTKDNESNNHPLRNPKVTRCSYLWNWTGAPCSIYYQSPESISSFLNATDAELDANADGIVTWQETGIWTLEHGNKLNDFKPYVESDVHEIRCIFHVSNRANAIDYKSHTTVLNVMLDGSIKWTGIGW